MTQRITDAHLNGKVETINRYLGFNPEEVKYSTVGAVVLAGAYGGTGVHRYVNEFGGVSDIFGGYSTKREVAKFLDGMIQAFRALDTTYKV